MLIFYHGLEREEKYNNMRGKITESSSMKNYSTNRYNFELKNPLFTQKKGKKKREKQNTETKSRKKNVTKNVELTKIMTNFHTGDTGSQNFSLMFEEVAYFSFRILTSFSSVCFKRLFD